MSDKLRVLIVEDSEDDTLLILHELRRDGYEPEYKRVENQNEMENALENEKWDIIISDFALPDFDGIRALKLNKEKGYDLPFILISGTIGEDVAVEAMKAGAHDYIMKDNLSRLASAVRRELKEFGNRQELKQVEDAIQTLVKSTVTKTGEDAFHKIGSGIKEWLGTDAVCLSQITDSGDVRMLSMIIDDDFKDNCVNNLKDLSCELVINETFCHYPEGAGDLLSESCKQCIGIDAEGFFGIRIQDENGENIGSIWTVSRKKLVMLTRTMNIMEIIAAKAGSQIRKMWAEERLLQHNEKLEKIVEDRTTQVLVLERQRMESEKLAAAGQMAATVAHEINNPLASIKGGFLLFKDAIPQDHKYYKYVTLVEKEIERIARMVKQMLDLSRPYQGEICTFDVISLVRDITSMLDEGYSKQSVIATFSVHDDILDVTICEDHLRQVLQNIIKNAVEASCEGGRVEVKVITKNDRFAIIVSDQGEGMSEEVYSNIFKPFFSTKNKYSESGMGLGLVTTKIIVDSMGGSIDCISEEGKGTTFTVDLPMSLIQHQLLS